MSTDLQAISLILKARGPMRLGVLRAALKGQRLSLTEDALLRALRSGGFVEDAQGGWTVSASSPAHVEEAIAQGSVPAALAAEPSFASPEEFTRSDLARKLGSTYERIREALFELGARHPEVDWATLNRRLHSGFPVAITPRTVELIQAELARQETLVARPYDELPAVESSSRTAPAPVPASAPPPADPSATELELENARAETAKARAEAAKARDDAAQSRRRAIEAERKRQDQDEERRARLRADTEKVRRESETRRRELHDEAQRAERRRLSRGRTTGGLWQPTSGGGRLFVVGEAETKGEKVLRGLLPEIKNALLVFNCHVALRRKEREVDAIVLHPRGIATVEQKDILRRSGVLHVPLNGPVTVDDEDVGHEGARTQARQAAQLLTSLAKDEPSLDVPYIDPYFAFYGDLSYARRPAKGDVRLCLTHDLVGLLETTFGAGEPRVSVDVVAELLSRLELPAVPRGDLKTIGFAKAL